MIQDLTYTHHLGSGVDKIIEDHHKIDLANHNKTKHLELNSRMYQDNPARSKHAGMQPPRSHSTHPVRQGAKDARPQKPAQRPAARQEQVRRHQLQTLDIPNKHQRRRSISAGNSPVVDLNSTQTFHNDMHVLSAGFDPSRAQLPLQTQVYGPEPQSAVSDPPRPQNRSKPKKEYPWLAKSKCDQPDFRFWSRCPAMN